MSKSKGIQARYSQEQSDWLLANYEVYSTPQLTDKFNAKFNTHYNCGQIRHYCTHTLGFSAKSIHVYTDIQEAWLESNYSKFKNYNQLADMFNSVFNTNVSPAQMNRHCLRLGYNKTKPTIKLTKEHKAWIVENYPKYAEEYNPFVLLADAFNKRFGLDIGHKQLNKRCRAYFGYVSCKWTPHTYTDEQKQWIKDHNNNHISVSQLTSLFNATFHTNIKSTQMHHSLRKSRYTKVRVRMDGTDTLGRPQYKMKYKHVLLWESYHNEELPKGKCVIFLNGDYDDFSKENLYCVDSHIAILFHKYTVCDRDTGLAVIAYLTLGNELSNKRKELQEVKL